MSDRPFAVVLDASTVIAYCSREVGRYESARRALHAAADAGSRFYAPGVLYAECLYVLCRKLADGQITVQEHALAVGALATLATGIESPPGGDASLVRAADAFQGQYGCSHTADTLYIALAAMLSRDCAVRLLTFDSGLERHGAACGDSGLVVLLT